MVEKSTEERFGSRPIWEQLESMARERIQWFIQELLEEEVTALVGRRKSERRAGVDAAQVYRNGHGKPRQLAIGLRRAPVVGRTEGPPNCQSRSSPTA